MGGALNIKNAETVELARRLAAETGESVTEAVTQALRERLAAVSTRPDARRLKARVARIQALVASLPDLNTGSDDEILGYDDHGLPA
jgi:antitoxin VapB